MERDAQAEIEAQKEIGAQTKAAVPQVDKSETGALMDDPEAGAPMNEPET
jgi:hypothetical protein